MQNDNVKFKVFFIFAIFLAILLLPKISKAATFYVDGNLSANCTTGNYSIANRACNGTDGNAYKTVLGGATVLSSGDTMYIRSGTYDENTIRIGANYASMATVSGYQNEWPVMRNNGDVTTGVKYYFLFNSTANNITFTKLEFTGTYGRADYNGDEQWAFQGLVEDDRYLIVIDNNYFHDEACFIGGNMKYWIKNNIFKTWGSTPFNSSSAIYIGSGLGTHLDGYRTSWNDATIIENNYFENSQYGGVDVGSAIDIHRGDTGDMMKYFIVRYNTFIGRMFWAMSMVGQYGKFYNNSAYNVFTFFGSRNLIDSEIINNIALNIMYYGFCQCDDTCTGITLKNNITSAPAIYWNTCNSCTISDNRLNADPKFLSATPVTWTDFRLQSISTAINSGLNLGLANQNVLDPNNTSWPPSTIDQNSQGSGWEIGAFAYREAVADTTPPAAPTGVAVN